MPREMSDDEFVRRYDKFEHEAIDDFIRSHSTTRSELEDTIEYLIRHREVLKSIELQKLEQESQKLIEQLHQLDRTKLLEELRCFKDMLALQRRLVEDNGNPRD